MRDPAVQSIIAVVNTLTPQQSLEFFVPMLSRLANGDLFTSRVSACALMYLAYQTLPVGQVSDPVKTELRNAFSMLCADETPMVRRAACSHLGAFATTVEAKYAHAGVLETFRQLAVDEQDSVRLLAVEGCASLVKVLFKENPSGALEKMGPVIVTLCQDKSWRVRYMVATKFCELMEGHINADETKVAEIVDEFLRLLRDEEAEVRTAAAYKVAGVAELVGNVQTMNSLVPAMRVMVKDECHYTRAALASVIMSVCPICSKQDVFEHLLPLFLHLLKDKHPEVRLNVIARLDVLSDVVGLELLSQSLLPAITELATDHKWRVRLAISGHLPSLARQLGSEFYDTKLDELTTTWLGDSVFSVRKAAAENVVRLVEVFGKEWAVAKAIPKVGTLASNQCCLYRLTAIYAMVGLANQLGMEGINA